MKHPPTIRGFTLGEVRVVIAIFMIVTAIAVPVSRGMMTRARAVNCSKNLRQIGAAAMLYAGDNQFTLPQSMHQKASGGSSWRVSLQPYASGIITFKCEDDPVEKRNFTYLLNDYLTPRPSGAPPDFNYSILAKIEHPEATLMFAEASETYQNVDHFHFSDYYGQKVPPSAFRGQVGVEFHGSSANYLFADGHVETLLWTEVQRLLRAKGSRFLNPTGK